MTMEMQLAVVFRIVNSTDCRKFRNVKRFSWICKCYKIKHNYMHVEISTSVQTKESPSNEGDTNN